ncbi:MAG: MFS transporter, partial [Planctomycetota bacterium]
RVDRTGDARRVLMLLSLASVGAFGLFAVSASLAWLWGCAFLFGCIYPPMHPILDAAAMQAAANGGFAYGRLRLVGSVSFLVVILAVGWWIERSGSAIVWSLLLGGLVVTTAAAAGLPRRSAESSLMPIERAPLWSLLRSWPFVLLLVAAALIQGSHATYYNLSTVHWKAHGIDETAAGALWAEGVFAEIVLLFVARDSVEKLRPTTLLMLGGGAAVVRWIVIGSSTSLGVLVATNWLHAFTFTCTYLGSLRALERRVPAHQRSTAQGLLGASTSGVGMVLGGVLGGFVYERWAGRAFFLMAAFAALGTGLAAILRRQANRAQSTLASSADTPPA